MPTQASRNNGYDITPTTQGMRLFLNGFPKSGLHLLALMIAPIAKPIDKEDVWKNIWAGMFTGNGWSNEPGNMDAMLFKTSRLSDGHYLLSHCGYDDSVERFLWYSGIAHIFIYRDPRDIAVSQIYHIFNENDTFSHPDKIYYMKMGLEKALEAVISGTDRFPGVMDRWQHYAQWLNVPWVMSVRFEDIRQNPRATAANILNYVLNRVPLMLGNRVEIEPASLDDAVNTMVETARQTEYSATFRRGVVGEWQELFSERHVELFKQSDKDNWLERLGYRWDYGLG